MDPHVTRRDLFRHGTQGALTVAAIAGMAGRAGGAEPAKGDGLWPGFPRQDQKLVAEIVGASHFDEKRVKDLVKGYPELANAWWDWGFGDWESPLGAAAHVGNRPIAEFLLDSGARMDIFAAAMLGMTDVVKSFVAARPGVQRTLGPHGIPLLAHAKAGGKPAADTVAYLEKLGDADGGMKVVPLTAEEQAKYLGQFASKQPDLKLACRANKAGRLVVDVHAGESRSDGRLIHHLGDGEFMPTGVPSVRLRFAVEKGKATAVTIRGSVPEVTLQRTGG